MSFSAMQYLEFVLEDDWRAEIPGRVEPVPQPRFVVEGANDVTRLDPQDGDIVAVKDGGTEGQTPVGMGWTHKRVEADIEIEIKTMKSRGRLEGHRTDDNESERYGGLKGEIERILDSKRKGDKEFDWIEGYEWNDLTEDVGFAHYRGVWGVNLTDLAKEINPDPTESNEFIE